jgi:hypothetical protein
LWSRKDLAPTVTDSWFPFLGTRGEHTWGSCVTNWKHDAGGTAKWERLETLDLVRQALWSFFPLNKEYLISLMCSWDCGNWPDGDSCGWSRPTTISTSHVGAWGSRDRNLLRSRLFFGFGLGDRTAWSPVCFELSDSLRDDLTAIAFVSDKLTLDIDLTFEGVENT